ncbi:MULTISPECIES: hypothetical protein [Methylobacteriaceae]|jgi:hypothetical protein|uniref:Threonyl-trna synthetase n=7 Tax=Methylobacteriaceae TaxID=119045 RepID=A0A509EML5_9HYPH|nr:MULTISPECIES: hypothetical protein [Methylobacteriaceae]MBY0144142.1 threonyl-trna synthetase [Methylorubrum populi]MRI53699.1 threonyl-trna synthetase [Methylobacterium sp. DB1607]ACS40426.1 Hypothetical protein MexAM1_META1p2656 [Methylorubrum extorquens AM1]MBD8909048.1 threonyl-trna synthetase [Methylorubrum zatmanii]MBK3405075.1 threonyl-trna synthetase [Methylorubrum rhodesianum]
MRTFRRALATAFLGAAGIPGALAGEAPFGLRWGPLTSVPKPSMADREGNVTALFYFQGRAPASGPDTEQVVLEVCGDEGLQQVIWFSRPFAEAELVPAYAAIYREGVRRYGEPQEAGLPNAVTWPAGRTLLAVRPAEGGGKRIVMVAAGELYEKCSSAHEAATGHPAARHTSDLLESRDRRMAP